MSSDVVYFDAKYMINKIRVLNAQMIEKKKITVQLQKNAKTKRIIPSIA